MSTRLPGSGSKIQHGDVPRISTDPEARRPWEFAKLSEDERLEIEVRKVPLKALKARDKNARFMTTEQIRRLSDNLKRDGALTGTVLVYWPASEERGEILSGHHRVEAAINAGIEEDWAHVILNELTEVRKVSIQLSHNAIVGQDDPAILADMYSNLDSLVEKAYSGLTDDDVANFDGVDISSIGSTGVIYREVNILFLDGKEELFKEVVERAAAVQGQRNMPQFHLASDADFEKFFDSLVRIKQYHNVFNTAIAIRMMAIMALERLEQLQPPEEEKA